MNKIDFTMLFMHDNQIKFSIFSMILGFIATGVFIIYLNAFYMTLCLVILIIAIIWFSYRYSTVKYFVSHAVEVEGVVSQVFTSSSLARINIKFNYEEKSYQFSQSTYSTRAVGLIKSGEKIICLIDKRHPEKAMIKRLICKS